jgi:AcrR family transcriptional regulator
VLKDLKGNIIDTSRSVREIIIKVAQDVFARFGFKKTTMDEIAQLCHKGKRTLYHYFKSKEEIFQTVVEKESEMVKEEISRAIDLQDTPQKKLRACILTRMQALNRMANFYSVFKDSYFEYYAFVEKAREKYISDELEMIKGILKEGARQGVFVINDLDLISSTFILAIKGLELFAMDNEVSELERKTDTLLDILFNGILKR